MAERDPSRRVDGSRVPSQRKPQRQASLHEVLTATANQAEENARFVVGNNGQRRVAGYVKELMDVANALATKWGVDPRIIPAQEVRELHLVYQRPHAQTQQISHPEQMVTQRVPTDDVQGPSADQPVDGEKTDHRFSSPPSTTEPVKTEPQTWTINGTQSEMYLANVLNQRPLNRAIALLRTNKQLTQRVLAELMGISKSLIDKMETGKRLITPSMVDDICNALQISDESLIREILMTKALNEERERRKLNQERMRTIADPKN